MSLTAERFHTERPDLDPSEEPAIEFHPLSGAARIVPCDGCERPIAKSEHEPYLDGDCDQDGFFKVGKDFCGPCRAEQEQQ